MSNKNCKMMKYKLINTNNEIWLLSEIDFSFQMFQLQNFYVKIHFLKLH